MAIGSMHKNLVKIAHVVLEISSRIDTQTQAYSSQYLRTPYGGKVKISLCGQID